MRPETTTLNRALLLIAAGSLAFWFVWFQWKLLLLAFAGLLLEILLHSAASWVERHTPLNPVLAYLATWIATAGVVAVSILLLGPRLITQLAEVSANLPRSFRQAGAYLQNTAWGNSLLILLHRAMLGAATGAKLTLLAKAIVTSLVDFIVVLVIGFFGALNPRGYRNGLLLLVPASHREQARELSSKVVNTLRSWLLGQMIPMARLYRTFRQSCWPCNAALEPRFMF